MTREQNNEKDTAGVIAPPPLIFLSGIFLGGIVQWFYGTSIFPPAYLSVARIFGGLLIIAGLAVIFIVRAKMQRAETNIEPWKPTTSIIDDGIYAYSRNPVYMAMIFIYLGLTLIFNAVWFLPFLILVLVVIHYGVVLREEKYLEKKFGEEYLNYKKGVRRWI